MRKMDEFANYVNEALESAGQEPIDTRPIRKLYAVINEVGSDIGDELWGIFESREEADKAATRSFGVYRYHIEEMTCRISRLGE